MATEKPITTETVALTEKKMDMSLDAIIKMSKSNTNVKKGKKQRTSNKKESFNGASKNSAVKAQRYMDSRSDVRQGAFAKRRSHFQGNQFPITTNVAHKAASATPLRGRPYKTGRMTNTNQSRFITPPDQNRSAAHRGFVAKTQLCLETDPICVSGVLYEHYDLKHLQHRGISITKEILILID
ncbi:unnamed protein product [Arabis nemorensis]|uniref:Uncharacterized protein n=1 Tax=Arabis nemorensis TaxID=586526 RepID=A0A565C585_9BRAS|nr:unnamed protein product [Arabis nemorensis]